MNSLLPEQKKIRRRLLESELMTASFERELNRISNLLNSNGQLTEPLKHNSDNKKYFASGLRHNDSHRRKSA